MKKFEGVLICTDLDGTLLKKDKTVSSENIEAIEYFKSRGGIFTFVTGRMPVSARDVYDMIKPNAPIGCVNGGGIYDFGEEKYLYTHPISPNAISIIEAIDKELPEVGIQVNTFDNVYFCKDNEAMVHFRDVTGLPNLAKGYKEIDFPWAKAVFTDFNPKNISALEALSKAHKYAREFDFICSSYDLFEILPKGSGKGNVFVKLAELLKVDISKTICVGDFDNDVSMIEAARLGVAVENASEAAKEAADLITCSNENHAIAKIIEDLDKGIICL